MEIRILLLVGAFAFLGRGVVEAQVAGDTLVARRLLDETVELNKQGNYEEAFVMADSARIIFKVVLGEETREVADALHQMGRSKYKRGYYDQSITLFEQSLAIRKLIFGSEHLELAGSYNNLGLSYDLKGEFDKAIDFKQKALEIRLKILGSEHLDVATSFNNIGASYLSKGEFDNANFYFQKALEIRLKILGVEHPEVAASYNNIGVSYLSKGEYKKAIEYCQKGLKIQIKSLGAEHPEVAASYNNIGASYKFSGEYGKAIEYHQKVLDILIKALGINHPDVAKSYENLGNSFDFKGEYDKAIEYEQKALEIRLKILGVENPDVAKSYNGLGHTYGSIGKYDKAIEYHQKALEIRLKILGVEHPDVGESYNNIGASYHSKGEFEKSIEYYQKALEIQLKVLGVEHPDVAATYSNIGVSYESKKDYDNAIKYKQKALEIQLKILGANHPDVTVSFINIGVFYTSKGEYGKALECYQKAITACGYANRDFSMVQSFEYLLVGIRCISQIFQTKYYQDHAQESLNQSFDYALQAINATEYQNAAFTSNSSQSYWLSQNYPIYEQAISISLLKATVDHNDTLLQSTFTYAEKSKSSLLQSQIKLTDALNFAGIPDSLLQKEHDLRIDITWREKQRQTLLDQGLSETDTKTLRISSIIFDLKNNNETLKKRFETQYPEYYRLKYDLSTVSLQYVQDTLLESKNQALLEYFVGDSSIYLFVVRPDTMIVQEVKRDFPLEDWIEKFRQGLYGYYTADKGKRDTALFNSTVRQYADYGQKLYQKLFAPVEQWLPKQVIIVPDGPLGYVPFDALLAGKPEDKLDFKSYPYLLNKYQFSYTYSATLLKEMRDKKHHHEPVKEFAAFAPFYNGDTTLLAGMYQYDDLMRKDLQPLAYSGPEVAAASKLMRGETIAGPAATEERFTSTAGDYRILHLATHGRADNRVGDYAFLAFSEIKDSIENELLYVKDLYNLELNADLVVLSACETGIGKLQRGEGIISLARAFAYAGVKSIVTTLWEVNDKSTSELMRYFYRELKLGKDKDEALRLARQRYFDKAAPRGLHPFFWAAFVPVGDMRPVR